MAKIGSEKMIFTIQVQDSRLIKEIKVQCFQIKGKLVYAYINNFS